MKILVVNIGSTSFKYHLFDMDKEDILARGTIERVGNCQSPMKYVGNGGKAINKSIDTSSGYDGCIKSMIEILLDREAGVIGDLVDIDAVGFKTAHGGEIREPSPITEKVIKTMEEYSGIVPAHNPPYINAIKRFQELLPKTPLVAVFETYFHKEIPDYAYLYSIPFEWYEKYNIRKYGFHGASHRFVSERVSAITHRPLEELKLISCHLGGSSSISAIKHGKSIDNSMGFSCQAGIPMSKRCGDIDPFIIPFVMEKGKLSFREVMDALVQSSGLLGISGLSSDIRDLEEKAASDNYRAKLALEVFAYSIKKYIGGYIAIMGGLDVLVFTGGIGENSPTVRRMACDKMEYLGIELDADRNECKGVECVISKDASRVEVLVIPPNEEVIVARETLKVLGEKQS